MSVSAWDHHEIEVIKAITAEHHVSIEFGYDPLHLFKLDGWPVTLRFLFRLRVERCMIFPPVCTWHKQLHDNPQHISDLEHVTIYSIVAANMSTDLDLNCYMILIWPEGELIPLDPDLVLVWNYLYWSAKATKGCRGEYNQITVRRLEFGVLRGVSEWWVSDLSYSSILSCDPDYAWMEVRETRMDGSTTTKFFPQQKPFYFRGYFLWVIHIKSGQFY